MSGLRLLPVSSHAVKQSSGRFVVLSFLALSFFALAHGQARIILNAGPNVATIAGNGANAKTQAGPAVLTSLGHPRGLVYDASGNLYVADSRNHQVSRIAPDGTLTILAGTGLQGFSGDNGPATAAQLNQPSALALRPDGTLLIADTGNHRIRSLSAAGIITTVAGNGTAGNAGDGGQATAASLRRPAGLAVDASGNLIVADTGNHRIRRIAPSGTITAVAGTGQEGDEGDAGPAVSATFRSPTALFILADGRTLVADTAARRIRSLLPDGTVVAYATGSSLRRPEGLSAGPASDLLISDADLQQILENVPNATTAIAGIGSQGPATQGAASMSALDSPAATATAADGSIAIADRRNHQVQRVTLPVMAFGNIPAGQQSAPQPLTVQNGGSSTVQVTALALPSGFASDGTGTCTTFPFKLAAGAQCTVSLIFRPQAQGAASGIATISIDIAPPATVSLTGVATASTALTASVTTMTTNGTIAYAGAPVRLTAAVSGALPAPPAGNITFKDGLTALSTTQLASSAGSVTLTTLATGQHTLQAVYSGDARYAASMSAFTVVSIVAAPDFTLSATSASYSGKTSSTITIPLTCLPKNGTLNQPVTLTVSGLPTGFTAGFLPPVITLSADPALSTLTITVPATVASERHSTSILLASALFLLPLAARRKQGIAALTLSAFAVGLGGCGGGFRTTSNTVSGSTSHSYNITVTANATGVLGDTLIHSIPVELVVTP